MDKTAFEKFGLWIFGVAVAVVSYMVVGAIVGAVGLVSVLVLLGLIFVAGIAVSRLSRKEPPAVPSSPPPLPNSGAQWGSRIPDLPWTLDTWPENHVWEKADPPPTPPARIPPLATAAKSVVPPSLPPPLPQSARPATIPEPYNWQDEVMAKHPSIGVKDSPANRAFVLAYKKAQASNEGFDPCVLADQVMRDLDHSRNFRN